MTAVLTKDCAINNYNCYYNCCTCIAPWIATVLYVALELKCTNKVKKSQLEIKKKIKKREKKEAGNKRQTK